LRISKPPPQKIDLAHFRLKLPLWNLEILRPQNGKLSITKALQKNIGLFRVSRQNMVLVQQEEHDAEL
jgi:hypothetical protein